MTLDALLVGLTEREQELVKTKYRTGGGYSFNMLELAAIFRSSDKGIKEELQAAVDKIRRTAGQDEAALDLLRKYGIPVVGSVS